jgi:hypothetical protein
VQRSKLQVCVVLALQSGDCRDADAPGPIVNDFRMTAMVYEHRTLNTTGVSAEQMMETLMAVLQHYRPQNMSSSLVIEGWQEIPPEVDEDKPKRLLAVQIRMGVAFTSSTTVVDTPGISIGGGSATITCSTGGATIYYTTDGSAPTNLNGTIYTAPVAVAPGTVVKARAYKTGLRASAVATATA